MLHTTSALLLVTISIIKHVELEESHIIQYVLCQLWSLVAVCLPFVKVTDMTLSILV